MKLHLYKYAMNKKLIEFKKRNKKRNRHLYNNSLQKGIDYIVCPVSNERLSMIKSSYIEKILQMTVEDYDRLYPGVRGISHSRRENIKQGLHKIDDKSGKSKYQIGQEKARQTLSELDENGISGYKKKGQKTRFTHLSNIDKFGRNGYERQVEYRLKTLLPNGLTMEQNAHLKQKETLIKNNKSGSGGASKASKLALKPITDYLDNKKINYYFDESEYGVRCSETGNYYFWDLTIPTFKIAIEYQSNAWHANPALNEDHWKMWKPPKGRYRSPEEVLLYDYNKARCLFRERQMITYYIWEDTANYDAEEILCLLKTLNMKY